jgi:hypothetical protein
MKLGMKTGILAAETALSAETGGLFLPIEIITGGIFGSTDKIKKILKLMNKKLEMMKLKDSVIWNNSPDSKKLRLKECVKKKRENAKKKNKNVKNKKNKNVKKKNNNVGKNNAKKKKVSDKYKIKRISKEFSSVIYK